MAYVICKSCSHKFDISEVSEDNMPFVEDEQFDGIQTMVCPECGHDKWRVEKES